MSHNLTQPEEIDRVLMEMASHHMKFESTTEDAPKCGSEMLDTQDADETYRHPPASSIN